MCNILRITELIDLQMIELEDGYFGYLVAD
jgi:hypothetical protein